MEKILEMVCRHIGVGDGLSTFDFWGVPRFVCSFVLPFDGSCVVE